MTLIFYADDHLSYLQTGTIIFYGCGEACLKYSNNKYAVSLQYLKKELSYEVDVLHAYKHESL